MSAVFNGSAAIAGFERVLQDNSLAPIITSVNSIVIWQGANDGGIIIIPTVVPGAMMFISLFGLAAPNTFQIADQLWADSSGSSGSLFNGMVLSDDLGMSAVWLAEVAGNWQIVQLTNCTLSEA